MIETDGKFSDDTTVFVSEVRSIYSVFFVKRNGAFSVHDLHPKDCPYTGWGDSYHLYLEEYIRKNYQNHYLNRL